MGVLRFGAFVLDQPHRALLRSGKTIELRSQAFDVLAYLAANAGRVVGKDELIEAVWPTSKPADDDSLVQCIMDIRRALGDGDRRIIKTLPRRGYVFAEEVSEGAPGPELSARADTSTVLDRRSRPAAELQTGWQRGLIAAVLLIAALAGSGWLIWNWARPPELTMMARPSLVVLPIKPLANDADAALATLADEIAAGIWGAPRGFLPVIRPSNAVGDSQGDPKAIGHTLGVRYLVRSLARREGEQVHLTVQLVEAQNAQQLWARDFAYRLGEPRAQNRTAARIGQTLAEEILRIEVRRPLPSRPEAGHFVILGRPLMTDGGDDKSNAKAIAYFEKALAADPEHVLALVHYARATAIHRLRGWMPESEIEERLAKAEAAIDLAIDRVPSAGAYLTRGSVLRAKGEHGLAIGAYERALTINQNFFPARMELGRSLIDVGKAEQAITKFKEALEASPTEIRPFMWYYWMGLAALHLPGRHEEALLWLDRSLSDNPHHDLTYRLKAVALTDAGRHEDARKAVKEALKRKDATLDDWTMPNSRSLPEVAKVREHIRDTLKRLGIPEGKVKAASTP